MKTDVPATTPVLVPRAVRDDATRPGLGAQGVRSVLVLVACASCVGTLSEPSPGAPTGPSPVTPNEPAPVVVDRPKVTLPAAQLKLLPFDVRLKRVAAAVGVPVSDAVFDVARTQRLALGAHDFANGTAPDLQWNAQRMAVWVEVMLPVCRDARVRSHLGAWEQGGLEKFAQDGFGRASTADDVADLSAALSIPGDDGWEATCLSLVSSTELLVQ